MTSVIRTRRILLASVVGLALSACSADALTGGSTSEIAGTYTAIIMRATPPGQPTIDLLTQGGNLTLVVSRANETTGTLTVPASALGSAFTASMAGTAVHSGNTVQFQQSADTFVRNLTFTVNGQQLLVNNQTVGGASFSITLVHL